MKLVTTKNLTEPTRNRDHTRTNEIPVYTHRTTNNTLLTQNNITTTVSISYIMYGIR